MKNRLKEIRFFRGMRQMELQKMMRINVARLSQIENGIIEPRESEKERFAKVLGLKPEEIFPVSQGEGE